MKEKSLFQIIQLYHFLGYVHAAQLNQCDPHAYRTETRIANIQQLIYNMIDRLHNTGHPSLLIF